MSTKALVVRERCSTASPGDASALSKQPYHQIGSNDSTHSPSREAPATHGTRNRSSRTGGGDADPSKDSSKALYPENKHRLGHEAERGSWCGPDGLLNSWRMWLLLLLHCLYAVRTEELCAVCSRIGGCTLRSCIAKLLAAGVQYFPSKSVTYSIQVRVGVI